MISDEDNNSRFESNPDEVLFVRILLPDEFGTYLGIYLQISHLDSR
jgi:hypothetical protein